MLGARMLQWERSKYKTSTSNKFPIPNNEVLHIFFQSGLRSYYLCCLSLIFIKQCQCHGLTNIIKLFCFW